MGNQKKNLQNEEDQEDSEDERFDDYEEDEEEDPFQNLKWKIVATGTQLSMVIIQIKKTHDLSYLYTPLGFSWRKLEINGVKIFPTALDQEETDLCIIYALLGIFKFQLKLLETEYGEIGFEPSMAYMLRVRNRMLDKTDLDYFLWELCCRNLSDEVEFARVNSLAKNHVKRFAVEYQYINPKADDGLDSIQEALIEVAGGVLLSLVCYKFGKDGFPLTRKDGTKRVIWIYVDKKVKGRKRKRVRSRLGHVVFCHGLKIKDGKATFEYVNSYGTKYNDKDGHDVCTIEDIIQVFTPQISFERSGFEDKIEEPNDEAEIELPNDE